MQWSAPLDWTGEVMANRAIPAGLSRRKPMAKHRSHSIEFKRPVVQDYLGSETLYGLAKRREISRGKYVLNLSLTGHDPDETPGSGARFNAASVSDCVLDASFEGGQAGGGAAGPAMAIAFL
jgi:hypothetical protein